MDFTLDSHQEAVLEAVGTLLSRHAGPARLHDLGGDEPGYDHDLDKRLAEAGFLDIAEPRSTCRLDAALVLETLSGALASSAAGWRLLVLPTLDVDVEGPVAVVPENHVGPARFAADADALVVIGDDGVRLVRPDRPIPRVRSRLGWPVGEVNGLPEGGAINQAPAAEVQAWARVALATEMVGAMQFALDITVRHVSDRRQFDRAIGSFQAVQHGLAECSVAVEGARWLALEAAFTGSAGTAAAALTQASEASKLIFRRTHQYHGAMGFTREYDLHLATLRLLALRSEAESLGRPAAACAHAHWGI